MAGRGRECVARVKRLKPRPRLPSLPLPPTRAIYKTFIHLAAISDALCLVQLGEYSLQLSQPLGNALYVCSGVTAQVWPLQRYLDGILARHRELMNHACLKSDSCSSNAHDNWVQVGASMPANGECGVSGYVASRRYICKFIFPELNDAPVQGFLPPGNRNS